MTLTAPSYSDVWLSVADRVERPAGDHATDPVAFIRDRLGETLWSKQREILQSIAENRYTAVQSCHGAGKSFLGSRALAWFAEMHPPEDTIVLSTAPTAAQVSDVLWREVNKAHIKGELKGHINRAQYPRWYAGVNERELIGFGRKPNDGAEAVFQGYHAPHMLVVIDEACGVLPSIWQQIDSLVANEGGRVLAIGNPDDPTSYFAKMCQPGSNWNVIRIDALRSPNFTREAVMRPCGVPNCKGHPLTRALMHHDGIPYSTERVGKRLRNAVVPPHWVEERLRDWAGIDRDRARDAFEAGGWDLLGEYVGGQARASALITAKVRGLFPTQNTNSVIPLAWAQAAVDRWHNWQWLQTTRKDSGHPREQPVGRLVVGADIARGGEDSTIVAPRTGDYMAELQEYRYADLIPTAAEVRREVSAVPGGMAVVDDAGVGGGVVDILRRQGVRVVGFVGSGQSKRRTATGDYKFKNDRSAAWWRMRDVLNPARDSRVMLPPDNELLAELTTPTFKTLHGGVIQVEPKDDVKKRLGRSPDRADAVVMSWWVDGAAPSYASDDEGSGALPWGSADPHDPNVIPYDLPDTWE